MRRGLAVAVRLLAVAVCILLLSYLTARALLAYQIHRASRMVAKVQSLNLGDSEESIRPLLKRYSGFRWNTQLGAHEDYNYVLEINPWRYPTLSNYRSAPIGTRMNARFRRAIGLRHWMVYGTIGIKEQKIVAILAETYVEGRTMWLGTSWRLAEKPREFDRDPNVQYLQWPSEPNRNFVTPGFLEMANGGGIDWEFWINPSQPGAQRSAAQYWRFSCLDSLAGCDSPCELLPEAKQLFREHAELAPGGGGWDEHSQACRHNPYEGRY